jgi:hypothetical protein
VQDKAGAGDFVSSYRAMRRSWHAESGTRAVPARQCWRIAPFVVSASRTVVYSKACIASSMRVSRYSDGAGHKRRPTDTLFYSVKTNSASHAYARTCAESLKIRWLAHPLWGRGYVTGTHFTRMVLAGMGLIQAPAAPPSSATDR